MKVFLDANIFMYAAGREHAYKAPSVQLIHELSEGRLEAVTDAEVLQEILHRYRRTNALPEGITLCERVIQLMPEILSVSKDDVALATRLLSRQPAVEPRDAVHAAVMLNHGMTHLYSYDHHFDHIPGLKRVEP